MKIVSLINIVFVFGCSLSPASSQSNECTMDTLTGECVYQFVEEMPVYCNGKRNVITDIFSLIEVDSDSENVLVTKVHLQFVINKNGELVGARIRDKDDINNMEKHIIEAVNRLNGTWSVGRLNGKEVSVLLSYAINID